MPIDPMHPIPAIYILIRNFGIGTGKSSKLLSSIGRYYSRGMPMISAIKYGLEGVVFSRRALRLQSRPSYHERRHVRPPRS